MSPTPLELLAPARDAAIAREAILHGADAVYIGGPSHGARAAAANSIEDLAELTRYAHLYGVRVYVTLNTIIHDSETDAVRHTVERLYRAGVDALIVQDMGLLRMPLPPIDLHASTQCDIRTPEKAVFLARCGFSQLVLPREFSLDEIREVRQAVGPGVALEAFVHGALCVSYSGDCQASQATCGRSANRGECAQICRQAYDLTDAEGHVLVKDRHLLSLRDLCRLHDLGRLADAGISSFKIEGRLKDVAYVKNVTAAYRAALDRVIAESGGRYTRSAWGTSSVTFTPDVEKAFNRGFTTYFIDGRPRRPVSMANTATPKWVGEKVARVERSDGRSISVKGHPDLANGDGLGYYDTDEHYKGFRLNRVEVGRDTILYPATEVRLKPGTMLYRNSDTRLAAKLARPTATRLIDTDMTLSRRGQSIWLRMESAGRYVETSTECPPQPAKSQQRQAREATLGKLGGTAFALRHLDDRLGLDDEGTSFADGRQECRPAPCHPVDKQDEFVPASVLAQLRRQAVALLEQDIQATHPYRYRQPEDRDAAYPYQTLTYHDNVANGLARAFYLDHGVKSIESALEAAPPKKDKELRVMTTRYCLRRELGACLLTPQGDKLPRELYLRSGNIKLRLECDCRKCLMGVYACR